MAHWRTLLDAGTQGGRYLPWKEVARATGLSRTTAWRLQKRDDFPAPYAISPGRVGYREDEVEAWRRSRDRSGARPRASPPADPVAAALPQGETAQVRVAIDAPSIHAEDPPPVSPSPEASKPRRRRSQHAQAIAQQMRFDF